MFAATEEHWSIVVWLAEKLGTFEFVLLGLAAFALVSLICGSVGALIVGNRMAFFSDALAHCSLAGVALGIVVTLVVGGRDGDDSLDWILPLVMIVFGVLVGAGIAYVRERTNLASDTVIGVFFAGAIGFGAILFGVLKPLTNKSPEPFLFGSVNFVSEADIVWLLVLGLVTAVVLYRYYNQLVFASFNPSLARSRRVQLRMLNYLFIVLLAVIVNVCLKAVGILLINAMLIVPAATAANLSRNLRQMFWWTITLSLGAGIGGYWASMSLAMNFGTGGCIVVLSVLAFAVSMVVGPARGRRLAAG